jgi:hypothetical protein
MKLTMGVALMCVGMFAGVALGNGQAQVAVHEAPDVTDHSFRFQDQQFRVKFEVPPGWEFTTKDGEVSSFHADLAEVPAKFELRGVASMTFNPFPMSTLGGAMFYFSVGPKVGEDSCLRGALPEQKKIRKEDRQDIGGMKFVHGHDEGGEICTEERDEVYAAYRKGSCYRFDLKINTFCAVSSGATEISGRELQDIETRMVGILSTVELGWEKVGPHAVPVPVLPPVAPTPKVPVMSVNPQKVGAGEL